MASSKPAPKASTITEIPRFQTTQPRVETAPKPRPTVEARPTPRSQPKATTSTPARSVYLRSYRVAVGSFTSASGAASVAAKLRAQGFKARALPSGRVSVVVLGPYSNESTAKTALDGVQGQYPDAILYRPNGTKLRAQAAPKPTPAPSEASNTVSGETPPITAAEDVQAAQADIAPATPAYLQVGAFKNVSSAQPLMRKLEGLGYPTTLRTSADGYTRVLVGPLEGDAFKRARSKLRTRGFQPFAVSQ